MKLFYNYCKCRAITAIRDGELISPQNTLTVESGLSGNEIKLFLCNTDVEYFLLSFRSIPEPEKIFEKKFHKTKLGETL